MKPKDEIEKMSSRIFKGKEFEERIQAIKKRVRRLEEVFEEIKKRQIELDKKVSK